MVPHYQDLEVLQATKAVKDVLVALTDEEPEMRSIADYGERVQQAGRIGSDASDKGRIDVKTVDSNFD